MAQATIRLVNDAARHRAADWCWGADLNTAVNFVSPDRRTLEQNAAMWAMLTDIAAGTPWHGQALAPDDWKQLFLANMDRGARMVPALDGRGFINLNTSSSALRVKEFSTLLDDIHQFAAVRGLHLQAPPP